MSHLKPGPPGRRSNGRRGQALVEFAIVLPIFLVVLCSIMYFGFLLYSKMTVINAAREGARAAAIITDRTTIPLVAPQRAQSAASGAGIALDTSQVAVACVPIKSLPGSCTFATPTSSKSGDAVSVTVTYPFGNPIPLHLALLGNVIIDLPSSFDLTSTVQMVLE